MTVKDTPSVPMAFWLVPCAPDLAPLQALIDALAQRTGGPRFEPHVTVHVGQLDEHDDADALLRRLCAAHLPITLHAGATGHSGEYFKTLFVHMRGEGVVELNRALRAGLRQQSDYVLAPHLSLLYHEHQEEAARAALAATYSLDGRSIRFDTLVAVKPAAGFESLARVEGWDTSLRCCGAPQ